MFVFHVTMGKIQLQIKALEWSKNVFRYESMGVIGYPGNELLSNLPENIVKPFQYPNDASDEI